MASNASLQRVIQAARAGGKNLTPRQIQALAQAELANESTQRNQGRSLSLQQTRDEATLAAQAARDAEARRMNDINTQLARERQAEQIAIAREQMANQGELQGAALGSSAEQARLNREQQQRQFETQQEQVRLNEERAARMEERQKDIDAFEKLKFTETTATQKAQYERNLAEQESDRNAMKSTSINNALMSVGTIGGLSLLKGSGLGDWLGEGIKGLSGSDTPTPLEPTGTTYDAGYLHSGTSLEGLQPTDQSFQLDNFNPEPMDWTLPEYTPNDFTVGGDFGYTPLEFDYSTYGGDLDLGGMNLDQTFDYGSLAGDLGGDYGGDLAGLGSDTDWLSGIDFSDMGGWF